MIMRPKNSLSELFYEGSSVPEVRNRSSEVIYHSFFFLYLMNIRSPSVFVEVGGRSGGKKSSDIFPNVYE